MTTDVRLVQINNEFSGTTYLPLAAGDLQAYAQQHVAQPLNYVFSIPIYKRIAVDEAVARLAGADIVGFSVYVWNRNISLEIARRLKEKRPSVLTVFGGPEVPDSEVPDRAEAFLRTHPFVDMACYNEGEQAFVHILEQGVSGRWEDIPSIGFIAPNGTFVHTKWLPRMRSLATLPSPYLTGVFDRLMREHPEQRWDGLWETNRGCPFACTFCDWGSNTRNKVIRFDLNTLHRELEWFGEHRIAYVFCCDANFGIFPRDVDLARKAAEVKAARGFPHRLSVQGAKNAEERVFQAQKILADAGLNQGVTLAFQSQDPGVLQAVDRSNISMDDYRNLQRRFTEAGVDTYSDMIIALPGETYDSFTNGVSRTIELGQHNRIQFGNLSMMPNAPMAMPAYAAKHGLKTIEVRSVIFHGVIDETPDRIWETEDIVVETRAMSRHDWSRTRVFCWMTSLLHFDKLLQIPLIVLHETAGIPYRDLIEVFTEEELEGFPTLAFVRDFFRDKATQILAGGVEYCPSKEWLNIYWPPDEYVFITLCREGRLDAFYREAAEALLRFCLRKGCSPEPDLLRQAMLLNKSLVKLPFADADIVLQLDHNLLEFYQSVRRMDRIALRRAPSSCRIDRTSERWTNWDEWCRFVVWYGNKRGAYLYGNTKPEPEKEGHF